jgi:hypothetical protein
MISKRLPAIADDFPPKLQCPDPHLGVERAKSKTAKRFCL